MKKDSKRIALVTGGNRGIGLEICRSLSAKGYHVLLAARSAEKGKPAADEIGAHFLRLDVADEDSVREAYAHVAKEFGRLDVLVNNAGVMLDSRQDPTAFEADPETITETFQTNTLGPFLMCQAFIPLMKKNGYGRVVNISSGMGQLSQMNGGYPAYRISKTALNTVTRIFADELRDTNVLVNSVCPGWVKTEMGGEGANRSLAEGADTPVWLATLPDGSPSGRFFRDRKEIDW
ncbi:MAG: SDR family oxidoreductase [Bacteriovoracia bacterium]